MKKIISIVVPLFLIISCATQSVITNSVQERTSIILEGNLIGLTVNVGNFYIDKVEKSDVMKDKSQRGTKIYKRILTVDVDPGNTLISISKDGRVVFKKEIYLIKGQVRRISI